MRRVVIQVASFALELSIIIVTLIVYFGAKHISPVIGPNLPGGNEIWGDNYSRLPIVLAVVAFVLMTTATAVLFCFIEMAKSFHKTVTVLQEIKNQLSAMKPSGYPTGEPQEAGFLKPPRLPRMPRGSEWPAPSSSEEKRLDDTASPNGQE